MKFTVNSLLAGMFVALTACGGGGGGGGGSGDTTQYESGTAAPTIVAPATVNAYPGGANAFHVTVADADTAQSNVKLTASVLSFTGLPTAPTVRTNVDTGVLRAERTVEIVLSDNKATGSAIIELTVSDGKQSSTAKVAISIISDPYGIQQANDIVVSYPKDSIELAYYQAAWSKLHTVGYLQPDKYLDSAARAHAAYLAANRGTGSTESSGGIGYTGTTAADRARVAGYSGTGVQDVAAVIPVSATNEIAATVAVAKFANSVYRSDVLRSGARDIGIGAATVNGVKVLVVVVGTKTTIQRYVDSSLLEFWPEPNTLADTSPSSLISSAYAAENETPSPIADNSGSCTGTAISVKLRNDQTLKTSAFTLEELNQSGKSVGIVQAKIVDATSDVNRRIGQNTVFLIPLKPLKANTLYSARYVGQSSVEVLGSTDIDKTWKFKTTSFDGTSLIGCSASL